MPYSRFAFALYLLATTVMIQTVLGVDPLLHFCTSNQNFSANDPYHTSFNRLVRFFYNQAPIGGFALGSLGLERERPYGLAMCRADVSVSDCRTCIVGAKIRQRCPTNKGAAIWYDYCLLKFSNLEFFGEIDNQYRFYMWNVQEVSNPAEFNAKVKYLLNAVSRKAYTSPKLYATGELELEASQKLYGLAQCSRDLSSANCQSCLDQAISELPNCCNAKRGGRVVGASCNFRYELYPFVNE
ncbi:hypothetical protein K2173_018737 [Erythroxylum novogranatense]|uniref:Gnk2-homologous domain-containing protein n=1 Tax=Erythroxylum novogranatense TaxID=1862640 RepID=A0AAV8SB34_9ROSI|nr:hypothetical protein K2173_018737 [Erythroxylum novogranatense]